VRLTITRRLSSHQPLPRLPRVTSACVGCWHITKRHGFVDLYKIRDLLKKLYGGEEAAKVRLAATESDWSCFGQILNHNDLRHAELAGVVPQVAEEDVRRLYRLVREWIRSHLRASGLAST
jgi:hypothetical protein